MQLNTTKIYWFSFLSENLSCPFDFPNNSRQQTFVGILGIFNTKLWAVTSNRPQCPHLQNRPWPPHHDPRTNSKLNAMKMSLRGELMKEKWPRKKSHREKWRICHSKKHECIEQCLACSQHSIDTDWMLRLFVFYWTIFHWATCHTETEFRDDNISGKGVGEVGLLETLLVTALPKLDVWLGERALHIWISDSSAEKWAN